MRLRRRRSRPSSLRPVPAHREHRSDGAPRRSGGQLPPCARDRRRAAIAGVGCPQRVRQGSGAAGTGPRSPVFGDTGVSAFPFGDSVSDARQSIDSGVTRDSPSSSSRSSLPSWAFCSGRSSRHCAPRSMRPGSGRPSGCSTRSGRRSLGTPSSTARCRVPTSSPTGSTARLPPLAPGPPWKEFCHSRPSEYAARMPGVGSSGTASPRSSRIAP